MGRRYLTVSAEGTLSITTIKNDDANGRNLTNALFELSRTTDMAVHFDPAVHTRKAIAAGISGHRPLTLAGECDDSDLPTDRYFRDAWEWSQ